MLRRQGAISPSTLAGVELLVVDDDRDAREAVGAVLKTAGATVNLAASVDEALSTSMCATAALAISILHWPVGSRARGSYTGAYLLGGVLAALLLWRLVFAP